MSAEGNQSFREWLVDKLALTSMARVSEASELATERVAKRLGVQVDVLVDARAEFRRALKESGHALQQNSAEVKFRCTKEAHQVWREEALRRGTEPVVLLRSLIHEYLMGPREPRNVDPAQPAISNGVRFRICMPAGAKRVLEQRALRMRVSARAIIQALVDEVLAGRRGTIPLISPGAMYEDESRYWSPTKQAVQGPG